MPFDVLALQPSAPLREAGFRFGAKGTHTSRTLMLRELADLFREVPPLATRDRYADAIIAGNVLGKTTASTRTLTNQRLGELYGLDRKLPLHRTLRLLWDRTPEDRPLLALLVALARDPLLRATATLVHALAPGQELVRGEVLQRLRDRTGDRMNDATLDKVARNTASSWTQAGFLEGRVRKLRVRVRPGVGAVTLALWLGALEGLGGERLLDCRWIRLLDCRGPEVTDRVLDARRRGLVHARLGGEVVEVDPGALDAAARGA